MYNLSEHHLGTNELIKCVTYASFSIRNAHWTLRPQDFETCCPYASDWLLAYGCPYASHCHRHQRCHCLGFLPRSWVFGSNLGFLGFFLKALGLFWGFRQRQRQTERDRQRETDRETERH